MKLRNISLLVLVLLAFALPSWAIGIAGSAGGKRVTVSVDGTWQGTYAAGTTYVVGDIVTDGTTNYRSLQNSNTGHTPASSLVYWQAILAKGDTGPTGATGPQGPTGAAGVNGKTVLTTSGAPASGTGVDGDYAYDPATYTMYGPKAAGVWPAGVIIKGADGAGFTSGADGTYGWLTDSNTSSYTECASGKYGLNFVGGVLYQCSNGTNSVFTSGDSLPSQTGNNGKYLTTNGTAASWGTVSGSSSFTTAPTYSDATCTAGEYALDSGYAYFCRTANTWDRIALAGWDNPSPVAPTLSSATIGTDGTTLTLNMSTSTSVGAGGNGGVVATGSTSGALAGTYTSGFPGTSGVYALPSSIKSGETVTLVYTQPGNGLEGTTGGADIATASGVTVTNNSTQSASAPTYYYAGGLTSASFTLHDGQDQDYTLASDVIAGKTGNITKIGAYIDTSGLSATSCKLALFDTNNSGSQILVSGGSFAPAAGAWNDISITPYAISSGTSVRVAVVCNAAWAIGYNSSGDGKFVAQTYTNFPVGNISWTSNAGKLDGVRIEVQ